MDESDRDSVEISDYDYKKAKLVKITLVWLILNVSFAYDSLLLRNWQIFILFLGYV